MSIYIYHSQQFSLKSKIYQLTNIMSQGYIKVKPSKSMKSNKNKNQLSTQVIQLRTYDDKIPNILLWIELISVDLVPNQITETEEKVIAVSSYCNAFNEIVLKQLNPYYKLQDNICI